MRAPTAQGAGARLPAARARGGLDPAPDGADLGLRRGELGGVGHVAQHRSVPEVDELQHRRERPAEPAQDGGVEAHLEEGAALEARAGGAAGLVVDDPDRAVRCDVDAVDDAPQLELAVEVRRDAQLALGRFETVRILEREVGVQEGARLGEPRLALAVRYQLGTLGALLEDGVPRGFEECPRRLGRARPGRGVEEALEHRVHERPAHRGGTGRLGEPVDHTEAEQERALHVVVRAGRRQAGRPAARRVGALLGGARRRGLRVRAQGERGVGSRVGHVPERTTAVRHARTLGR